MSRSPLRWPVLSVAVALFFSVVFFASAGARAQSNSSGTITGTVSDPQGAVIPGVTIVITDVATKTKRTAIANGTGEYVLPDVPPGTYNITASKSGFSTDQITGLEISVGTQTTANFKMDVGAENTTVEVTASNADLQTLSATTGTVVAPALVQSLPAIGRDVATFVTMQPGVTPGGNVAGTTVDQTTFQLDGGSNTSDMDGTSGVYTSGNVNSSVGGALAGTVGAAGVVPMPQDSIEEFKVNTSGQTADFNNSSGSQSQIVTKRGHDKIHGTAYEYYLDNSFNANTWQNNFQNAYTPKPSYHYSRFGVAVGGPITPYVLGGKTYLFGNYEGFRYPQAATFERTVPSYEFLQLGQMTFGSSTYSSTQLKTADPRGIGFDPTLQNFYSSQLPIAPVGDNGPGNGYPGVFDKSCGSLSGAVCDSVNVIGYKANLLIPQTSNFLALRLDHDFGQKWHLMLSYRYYKLNNLTNNQVDFGGGFSGDKVGVPVALASRPQVPSYYVIGLNTNISSSLTNDFHFSYTHNAWIWKDNLSVPQVSGASGAIEPLGESSTIVLSPYNVNAQNVRTRIWDGKDKYFRDDLTKLKGDHLIQFGGQFQHNFNYHQRTDNGASINYTPTYQIGGDTTGGNITYSSTGIGGLATTGPYRRLADTYYGFVTAAQVANTYANVNGTLNLNAPDTAIGAHTSVPYYNLYATDTWKLSSSLTVNYGLSYAIEMPPSERNGNQVMFTDTTGNAIKVQDYLNSRKAAALTGQVYEPEIGFALIHNVIGSPKYPYNPYYGAVSPRVAVAWNPKLKGFGGRIFGDGATVVRAGYGRIYGRINGDVEVLNPLLSPGLILATQCKYDQNSSLGSGTCTQSNFTESSAYRFGPDGVAPTLAGAALPATLSQPYHPGYDGPGVSIASPVDPSLRPNDVDTINFSIQRQINRKMLIEVGYIGRLIHHEYVMLNPNTVPYMMSLGGQSFESAYVAIETGLGCTVSAAQCSKGAAATVTPQAFFETALGGSTSFYCTHNAQGVATAYGSCTAALMAKQNTNLRAQNVFSLWQALDNNVNGANGAGFVFGRSLMGTATSNAAYGGAGQVVTGISIGTGAGYGNYHGGYASFKTTGFHGLTLQENLTFSKALGLGSYNQSTSSIAAEDSFNLSQQYGVQPFNQKLIFNTFIVYQPEWYKHQEGIVGRVLGGWTISPVVVAGTGQPLVCTSNNAGQNFGGEDGSTFTDSESCVFTTPYTGGYHTHRGITGGTDPNYSTISVGTTPKGSGSAAVNMFTNPVAVYDTVRPPILGLDTRDGGAGPINGLGYLNVDLSIRKEVHVWEKAGLEFSGTINNVLNHLDFANPSLNITSTSNWGTTKTQGNTPRAIQMGVRVNY